MKKIVLFAAGMILCAGLTFAQNPQKTKTPSATRETPAAQARPTTTTTKPAAQTPSATRETPAAQARPTTTTTKPTAQTPSATPGCGNCPQHKQCQDKNKTGKPANSPSKAAPKLDKSNTDGAQTRQKPQTK